MYGTNFLRMKCRLRAFNLSFTSILKVYIVKYTLIPCKG